MKNLHDPAVGPALKQALIHQARLEGFDVIGFAPPLPPPRHEALPDWLAAGHHAGMAWLARSPAQRQDPRTHLPDLATVVVVGLNHRLPPTGQMASHARHRDYHLVMAEKAQRLVAWLSRQGIPAFDHRLFVDWGATLEKPLAVAAGLGWQGKNSLLVNRRFGCWLLLAEILLPIPMPPDQVGANHCGSCQRCQQACPTRALEQPYRLDSRRCLAYHTIENRGPIPRAWRQAMGQRVFGCDDCLAVCPWNRFAPLTTEPGFQPADPQLSLQDMAMLDRSRFETLFQDRPLIRTGLHRILRNVAVALGNSRTEPSLPALIHLLAHPSPLVRLHAAWGLGNLRQMGMAAAELPLRQRQPLETTEEVRQELAWALGEVTGRETDPPP